MLRRSRLGLAFGLVLALSQIGSAPPQPPTGFVGAVRLSSDDPKFGGFSAVSIGQGGASIIALSDRGSYTDGPLMRDETGRLTGANFAPMRALSGPEGVRLRGNDADSEALAIGANGSLYVGFEVNVRILRYDHLGGSGDPLPTNPAFTDLRPNRSLEALAIDANGTLYTIPERPAPGPTLPLYRLADGIWLPPLGLPRPDNFRPVAADIGPDGRLYLLERRFHGPRGFASRLRRFDLDSLHGETLLQTSPGLHDNLEGLSVWQARDGLRATMISDDNFLALQVTEIVEYRLPD
ncbi:MAG: esterase-like activity of phytase family protein [Paracoccaceae bacterium]